MAKITEINKIHERYYVSYTKKTVHYWYIKSSCDLIFKQSSALENSAARLEWVVLLFKISNPGQVSAFNLQEVDKISTSSIGNYR
jgi:hypothetical protein